MYVTKLGYSHDFQWAVIKRNEPTCDRDEWWDEQLFIGTISDCYAWVKCNEECLLADELPSN